MSENKNSSEYWSNLASEFFNEFGEESLQETVPVSQIKPMSSENRMILNIIFVIDVSGSMRGTRIAQVNYALENIFKELKNRDDLNSVVKVAIMEFCDVGIWKTPQPLLLEDFIFTPIDVKYAYTNYGNAFVELEKKLHKTEFFNPNLGEYFAPLILFISDGEPVDVNFYPSALEVLKNNPWFKRASKYAIAVGEEAKNMKVGSIMEQFTGIRENVRYADEGAALCDLIEFITIKASEVQTSMVSNTYNGAGGKQNNSVFDNVDNSLFSSLFSGN